LAGDPAGKHPADTPSSLVALAAFPVPPYPTGCVESICIAGYAWPTGRHRPSSSTPLIFVGA